jgi:hypothetical protein
MRGGWGGWWRRARLGEQVVQHVRPDVVVNVVENAKVTV